MNDKMTYKITEPEFRLKSEPQTENLRAKQGIAFENNGYIAHRLYLTRFFGI